MLNIIKFGIANFSNPITPQGIINPYPHVEVFIEPYSGLLRSDANTYGIKHRWLVSTAYPTQDGVIDTIQWEGWREGVDDVKYLTTLLELIEEAKAEGKDTSDAENWLADLKTSSLGTKDLNAVRSQMIGYILYFLEKETSFNNELAST